MGGNGETESRTPFIKSLLGASVPPEQNPMFVFHMMSKSPVSRKKLKIISGYIFRKISL